MSTSLILIVCLSSPSWQCREKAHHALSRLPEALPSLKVASCCKVPEIAGRASGILKAHYCRFAEVYAFRMLPTNYPRMPWIDMLPDDHEGRDAIVAYYLWKGQSVMGRSPSPEWSDYRLSTALYMRDLLRQGYSVIYVRGILDKMAEREREWIKGNGSRYNPPLTIPGG